MRQRTVQKPDTVSPALDLYTIPETAAILGVSPRLVSLWIRAGALPALRLGPGQRLLRIRRGDLEAFVAGKHSQAHVSDASTGEEAGDA